MQGSRTSEERDRRHLVDCRGDHVTGLQDESGPVHVRSQGRQTRWAVDRDRPRDREVEVDEQKSGIGRRYRGAFELTCRRRARGKDAAAAKAGDGQDSGGQLQELTDRPCGSIVRRRSPRSMTPDSSRSPHRWSFGRFLKSREHSALEPADAAPSNAGKASKPYWLEQSWSQRVSFSRLVHRLHRTARPTRKPAPRAASGLVGSPRWARQPDQDAHVN